MCQLSEITVNSGKKCRVAEIKKDYIINIINKAWSCPLIDKIVLFGSAIEERCTMQSDIDIAVFGNKTMYKALRSKEYRTFTSQIYNFGSFQDYDILYFQSNSAHNDGIMKDIQHGAVIFQREG